MIKISLLLLICPFNTYCLWLRLLGQLTILPNFCFVFLLSPLGSNMGANRLIQQKHPISPYLVNLSTIVILLHVTTNSEVWGMLWFASEICIKGSCFE